MLLFILCGILSVAIIVLRSVTTTILLVIDVTGTGSSVFRIGVITFTVIHRVTGLSIKSKSLLNCINAFGIEVFPSLGIGGADCKFCRRLEKFFVEVIGFDTVRLLERIAIFVAIKFRVLVSVEGRTMRDDEDEIFVEHESHAFGALPFTICTTQGAPAVWTVIDDSLRALHRPSKAIIILNVVTDRGAIAGETRESFLCFVVWIK
jgi:hypothetical protein